MRKSSLLKRNSILAAALILISCTKSGGGSDDDNGTNGNCEVIGLESRIKNGKQCIDGKSAVVSLNITSESGVGLCTGTLITPSTVLTAAHCFEEDPQEILITGSAVGAGSQRTQGASVVVHPLYSNAPDGALRNDIALVELEEPFDLPTLPVITSLPAEVGGEVNIFGYGLDDNGKQGGLRGGKMFLTSVSFDNLIAEFDGTDSNTCFGDSGGPAVITGELKNGKAVTGLIGITSAGDGEGKGDCGPGETSYFTYLQSPEVISFLKSEAPGLSIR